MRGGRTLGLVWLSAGPGKSSRVRWAVHWSVGGKGRGPDAGEWAGTAGLDWGGLWFERGSRAEREGKEVEAGWAEES